MFSDQMLWGKLTLCHCFYKCLNRTLVMLDVLGPYAIGKLTLCHHFCKYLNKTLVMPDVLGPDAMGKLTPCYHFYTHMEKLISNGIFTPLSTLLSLKYIFIFININLRYRRDSSRYKCVINLFVAGTLSNHLTCWH